MLIFSFKILTYFFCKRILKQFYFKYVQYISHVFDLPCICTFVFAVFYSVVIVIPDLGVS